MATIGDKLKALAKAKDLSIPQLAKALGYDRADNFYSIANGRSRPGWEIIEGLARQFPDLNLDWLIRDDPRMFNPPGQTDQDKQKSPSAVEEPQVELLKAELRHQEAQLAEKDKRLADKEKIIELLERASRQ